MGHRLRGLRESQLVEIGQCDVSKVSGNDMIRSIYLLLWTVLACGNLPTKASSLSPRPQVSEIGGNIELPSTKMLSATDFGAFFSGGSGCGYPSAHSAQSGGRCVFDGPPKRTVVWPDSDRHPGLVLGPNTARRVYRPAKCQL
jgi:hypothetical protein